MLNEVAHAVSLRRECAIATHKAVNVITPSMEIITPS